MKHLTTVVGSLGVLTLSVLASDARAMVLPDSGSVSVSGNAFYVVNSGGGTAIRGDASSSSGGIGVFGVGTGNVGIYGNSSSSTGVYGQSTSAQGVYGTTTNGRGVWGHSHLSSGVFGDSDLGHAVSGFGQSGCGILGHSVSNNGVMGYVEGPTSGVYGENDSSNGGYGIAGRTYGTYSIAVYGDSTGKTGSYAGVFDGNVAVHGTLSKSAGSFMIDHPLDRENKILRHSFVEAPEMLNIYSGTIKLDDRGEAWVALPKYFSALNKDYRYQLTNVGASAQTYVAEEVKDNKFKIAGGKPGMKVSWQVSGVRQDAYAEDHRIVVEENKALEDRGKFIYARAGEVPMRGSHAPQQHAAAERAPGALAAK